MICGPKPPGVPGALFRSTGILDTGLGASSVLGARRGSEVERTFVIGGRSRFTLSWQSSPVDNTPSRSPPTAEIAATTVVLKSAKKKMEKSKNGEENAVVKNSSAWEHIWLLQPENIKNSYSRWVSYFQKHQHFCVMPGFSTEKLERSNACGRKTSCFLNGLVLTKSIPIKGRLIMSWAWTIPIMPPAHTHNYVHVQEHSDSARDYNVGLHMIAMATQSSTIKVHNS